MTLQYRIANPADHEAMREIVLRSYGVYEPVLGTENWAAMKRNITDEESVKKLLQSAVAFVCEDGEQIVGAVYLMPSGETTPFFNTDWAHIRQLGVLPERYGLGVATKLMQCCIAHAKQTGEHTLALHTSAYQSAWHIYERLGFIKQKNLGLVYGHEYWLYTLLL